MISFNCIEDSGGSFDTIQTSGIFRTDDKILTRDPQLKFATLDNSNPPQFVGGLINHDRLRSSLGYMSWRVTCNKFAVARTTT